MPTSKWLDSLFVSKPLLRTFMENGGVGDVEIEGLGVVYHVTPVSANFTLNPALVRFRSDMPVKQVFDLQDFVDADAPR